jgi:hypothetical protein
VSGLITACRGGGYTYLKQGINIQYWKEGGYWQEGKKCKKEGQKDNVGKP